MEREDWYREMKMRLYMIKGYLTDVLWNLSNVIMSEVS